MKAVKNHPLASATTVAALLAAFLQELVDWLAIIAGNVPAGLLTSGKALLLGLVGLFVGKLAERYTWPNWKVQEEFLRPVVEDQEHWSVPITEVQDYGREV